MSAPEPETQTQPRTLIQVSEQLRGRRRSAPRHERSSDVTRTRGWLIGALLGGLGLAGALSFELGRGQSLAPSRSFGRPHQVEGLDCASCHGEGRPGPASAQLDPADACVECHGQQRSTRAPHASALARGTMRCTTCHPIHAGMGGIHFEPGEPLLRWRGAASATLSDLGSDLDPPGADLGLDAPWPGREPAEVALVEIAACMGCHDPARAEDPMAHCALGDRRGPTDIAVCFDEHTPLLVAAGTERAALWELAREAASLPAPDSNPARGPNPGDPPIGAAWLRPLAWLGLSLGFAVLGWFGARSWARRRERATETKAKAEAGTTGTSPNPAAQLRPAERRRLPTIDASTCIGCSACVDACPYDVLELRAYVAVVAKPDDCCGLSLCEQRCPNGSLVIQEGERITEHPAVDDALESRVTPGVHLAGDITGLPLIRNAINQGAHAVREIAAALKAGPRHGAPLDLVIVGAGPAGISAALAAAEAGLRYEVIEQASAAASIRSFPRGKLVFDQPLGMPMVGELWLRESTKEELLGKWLRIIRSHNLKIREQTRVLGCARQADGTLEIRCADGTRLRSARVLLACGRRGTPRRLEAPVAEAMIDHVHYNLADARSFAGQRVCVVGLGDVAMEAAVGLANQADTHVTLSYRGTSFRRGKRRNIEAIEALAAAGRVELLWGTEVEAVEPGRVRLAKVGGGASRGGPGGTRLVEASAVFVMVGNVPPTQLLEAFGVAPSSVAP